MRRESVFQVLKAACAAVVLSFAYVLVFSLLIHLFSWEGAFIRPVNQVFKIICIAAGSLIFIRGPRGLFKGCAAGGVGIALAYLVFGLIGGFGGTWLMFLAELALGCAAGGIAGIIAANIKKI